MKLDKVIFVNLGKVWWRHKESGAMVTHHYVGSDDVELWYDALQHSLSFEGYSRPDVVAQLATKDGKPFCWTDVAQSGMRVRFARRVHSMKGLFDYIVLITHGEFVLEVRLDAVEESTFAKRLPLFMQ